MKKLIRSFLYIIPLLILGAVFISSVLIDTNSDRFNISETEEPPRIEKASVVLLPAENNNTYFSTFSVSPTSYDFGERCVEQLIPAQFNLSVHNTGGGTENGQVQINPSNGFTCAGGCSYSLAPSQSQYVTIQFIPPSTGPFSATAYFTYSGGYITAGLSGEGTWDQPPCPQD